MGLDMYLYVQTGTEKPKSYEDSKYVSFWEHNNPEETAEFEAEMPPSLKMLSTSGSPHGHVWEGGAEICAIYWRKANAIHSWFVENCQGGIDECQPSPPIDIEQLAYLMKLCNDVLADPSRADELLPPQAGFFFGGTEVDEWYLRSLQETVDGIYKVISGIVGIPGARVYYQSSW